MPSYIDEEVEMKLFAINTKKYPERAGLVSSVDQWEAVVEGVTGLSVGEAVMIYARGEGHVIEVGDNWVKILMTERKDAPHVGDRMCSYGRPAPEFAK
ncbi:MAG: hypothetical protein IJF59_05070 [Clostridia bacterium]|nr:hypothetical protein [Clostridia bacterium]MBQ3078038.1 hypothetical protein [Clostridia bacterium]